MMRIRIVYSAAAILMSAASCVSARPWYTEPAVSLSAGYIDNPRLESSVDEEADLTDDVRDQSFGLIGADIRVGSETESDLIAFDFAAIARRFEASQLDSELIQASGLYERDGVNNDFGFEAGLSTDSTIETELEDTGILEENVDRDLSFVQATLTSRYTPQLIGEFELAYNDVSFDADSDTFTDYKEYVGSAQLNRILSERTTVFGLVEYVRYRPTDQVNLGVIEKDDFAGVQLGISYNLTEQLAASFSAGSGFLETDQSGEAGSINFSETEAIYNAGLDYVGERNTIAADFSRTFDSSADGGLSELEAFTLSLIRPETLGGTFGIDAAYITRDSLRGEVDSREYYTVQPLISWEINPNLYISARAQYRDQKLTDQVTNITERADSISATIGLVYDFGRKRISY